MEAVRTVVDALPALAANGTLTPEAWRLALVDRLGPEFAAGIAHWDLAGFDAPEPPAPPEWNGQYVAQSRTVYVSPTGSYWLHRFAEGDRSSNAWRALELLLHETFHGLSPQVFVGNNRAEDFVAETFEEGSVEFLAQRVYAHLRYEDPAITVAPLDDVTRHSKRQDSVQAITAIHAAGGDAALAALWRERTNAARGAVAHETLYRADTALDPA